MDAFEQLLRQVVGEVVRTVVREELAVLTAPARPKPPAEPLYLTPRAAARIVGVSVKSVQRWVQDGVLHGQRVGRLVRIARADLDAFMEGDTGRKRSTKSADEVAATVLSRRTR